MEKIKVKTTNGLTCWWVDTIKKEYRDDDEFWAILINTTNGAVISLPIERITVIDENYKG